MDTHQSEITQGYHFFPRGYHFSARGYHFSPRRYHFSPRGYHFPLEVIIFPLRLSFSLEAIIYSSRLSLSLEAIIFPPRLSFFPRGYHFPLKAIIFPWGYHFPPEAIIFPSKLSFTPRGYLCPFEAIIFPTRRVSSKSRAVEYILITSLLLTETRNHPKSKSSSPLLTFCLLYSSCKRSTIECWVKVPPRECQSYPRFSSRWFDFSRKETTLIPHHSNRCSYF